MPRRVRISHDELLALFAERATAPPPEANLLPAHVFYKDGSPVAGAEVEWHSFNAVGGILPSSAHTNEKGSYPYRQADDWFWNT